MLLFKERALRFADNLEKKNMTTISEGVTLERTSQSVVPIGRSLLEEQLSENPEIRENQLDDILLERVSRFLGSHTLNFKLPEETVNDMQRSLDEGNSYKS